MRGEAEAASAICFVPAAPLVIGEERTATRARLGAVGVGTRIGALVSLTEHPCTLPLPWRLLHP
jgi:hypothetical protein